MGGLFNGIGQLLGSNQDDIDEAAVEDAANALDLAMQAAIEKHEAEKAAAAGMSSSLKPRVSLVQGRAMAGAFGRRGAVVD